MTGREPAGVMDTPAALSNVVESSGRILIVDDQEINRQLLYEILEPRGYELLESDNGHDALRMIRERAPDLLLLDVTMPGMDGLEVCRRIRADPSTAALPVIMVTALAHRQQHLDGIAAGASDYLTKPVDSANLLLRIRNAMHLRRLHLQLSTQFEQLQRLEEARDTMVHMLVHDLRSPLQAIGMRLDFAQDRARELDETEMLEDIESVVVSARVMREMVSNVLDVSRLEDGLMPLQPVSFDLLECVREAADLVGSGKAIRIDAPPGEAHAWADPAIVRRVISNLVANACKFSGRHPVELVLSASDEFLRVEVRDAGPGIALEHHQLIFDKFAQLNGKDAASGRSTGLGLPFCKLAVLASGGEIGLDSVVGKGATFWFTVPKETRA